MNEYSFLYLFDTNYTYLSYSPVIVYSNADIYKMSIIKDNKEKSGVYKWTNIENNKSYVGGSVNLSPPRRLAQYYNINILTCYRSLIHKAILKYGYSKFKVEILEYCKRKDVIKREQYYMDTIKPEYNILKVAGSPLGHVHTPETIEKMRIKATGRKHTVESIAKMMGRTHSEATKNKIKNILQTE